jgi:lipoprotein-releasing system permease protein
MYKLLLSSRYLRTRFIALASIISVMLGVATMIVVNSVMAGFRYEMRERLHSLISDIVIESTSTDGSEDSAAILEATAMAAAGDQIAAIAPTVEIYGMLSFGWNGKQIHRPVTLIGIDPLRQDAVSPLKEFLQSRRDETDKEGRITAPALFPHDAPLSWELSEVASKHRADWLEWRKFTQEQFEGDSPFYAGSADPAPQADAARPIDPFAPGDHPQTAEVPPENSFDGSVRPPAADPTGLFGSDPHTPADPDAPFEARVYVGIGLIGFPFKNEETGETEMAMFVHPGEDVNISTIKTGIPDPARFTATVVDIFKSGMSEFDSNLVLCNIEELQKVRGMIDPATGEGAVTMLKIRLKDYDQADRVIERLQAVFPPGEFQIYTWEQKRAPILQAVEVESAILNVLLFLIIAVAGFGILAIFYMIVVEKTRDIGVLKALGASSRGVMAIFLSYGLSLGVVGSGVGVVIGLTFVYYINEIEALLSKITGKKVFDETIYYFDSIPTLVSPLMVFWVALGAMTIAVLASVLPARRAACLDPVQALRYE